MSEHDPICPCSEVPDSGCLCLWLRDARADERERIAGRLDELAQETAWPRIRIGALTDAYVAAAKVARADG